MVTRLKIFSAKLYYYQLGFMKINDFRQNFYCLETLRQIEIGKSRLVLCRENREIVV